MMPETQPLWSPAPDAAATSRLGHFASWLREGRGRGAEPGAVPESDDYRDLWRWSTRHHEDFWAAVWDYFDLGERPDGPVTTGDSIPDTRWFPGARVNYVSRLFHHCDPERPAIMRVHERTDEVTGPDHLLTFADLRDQVSSVARLLREIGVEPGDRVAGYLPNTAEAVVAFLATASIGAVWAACGQDYAPPAAAGRLGQLEPRVLVASAGYDFAGRYRDQREAVAELTSLLPTVEHTILTGGDGPDEHRRTGSEADRPSPGRVTSWADAIARPDRSFAPEPVPFDHPLWVVFSSGTTGSPKGLVHSHGGVLLEHLKALGLHFDLGPEDRLFWYTSTSWMMWNFQVSALLLGASIVCYDGSPTHPGTDATWEIAARTRATVMGTSPGYLRACEDAGCAPARDRDLTALRTIGVTGAPFPESSAVWVRDHFGPGVPALSIIGGTDVVTAFLGGAPTVPVWPGQISCPWLGVAVDSYDDSGTPVRDAVGELVITAPMPSMPLRLWNDHDGQRYHQTYFDTFPGVWRHGDWVTITSDQGVLVHGRSDATLNRGGIRIGTADIYEIVEDLPEVAESMVIGVEQPDGGYWMPLFVAAADGHRIDDRTRELIARRLRTEASPRHVPDEVIVAPGIPHTKTGKKLEVPVKQVLLGRLSAEDIDPTGVDDPALLDWYAQHAASHRR